MQKLSVYSVLTLLVLAELGVFLVTVYNPFNSNANSLQHPVLSSPNQQTIGANPSGSTTSPAGNSTSSGGSLLTNSPPSSSGSGGVDGGSSPDS